ncbi:MAG TPA: type II toxin-antitoxin system VapC family toxin [Thermoanaerobaculia bacterium]|nr:type II toxin-antitoxin system VapC family toxin [Thermoanaerobaculia bacterium]
MTFLVDANVLCEPTRPAPSPKVIAWLEEHEREIVVDAVVLGEISAGVLGLSAGRKRERLEAWLESVAGLVECVSWDAAVARRWGRLVAESRRKGCTLPLLDSMIAATALHHGFTVATRNVADFRAAGVAVVDPFA